MDLFNKKKIVQLENKIHSLEQGIIKEQNSVEAYKRICEKAQCSTLLLEENKQLIKWIKSILEEFGTVDVYSKERFHIPVYKKTELPPFTENLELREIKNKTIVIPGIVIHEQNY